MSRSVWVALVCVLIVGLPACADGPTQAEDTVASASSASSEVTTTTDPGTAATPTTLAPSGFDLVEGVEYHGADDRFRSGSGVLDVYRPTSVGPWPVIVIFHGDPRAVDKAWVGPMAEDLAARNRLVVAPTWGQTTVEFAMDASLSDQWDALVHEVRCAMAFVFEQIASYGGDPENVTVAGYSAGGNAAMMAVLSDLAPLDSCSATGPVRAPVALVPMEADMLIGAPDWDSAFEREPEAFYSLSPWRDLSDADDFPVHIVVAEVTWSYFNRPVGDDPYASFLADRHIDIDLIADLSAMGALEDGTFDPLDANAWAYEIFGAAGYQVDWVVLPDTRHAMAGSPRWGMTDEAWEIAVDTLVNATESG